MHRSDGSSESIEIPEPLCSETRYCTVREGVVISQQRGLLESPLTINTFNPETGVITTYPVTEELERGWSAFATPEGLIIELEANKLFLLDANGAQTPLFDAPDDYVIHPDLLYVSNTIITAICNGYLEDCDLLRIPLDHPEEAIATPMGEDTAIAKIAVTSDGELTFIIYRSDGPPHTAQVLRTDDFEPLYTHDVGGSDLIDGGFIYTRSTWRSV